MTPTTGRQPVPAAIKADMSQGYQDKGGLAVPQKWEFVIPSPAGSMSASATDMAKFMIAHIANGAMGGQRILADSTAVLMHRQQVVHDPRLPGFALGFYESSSHGLRIIGHGGDTQWFHTDLARIPGDRLGSFISLTP